MSPVLFQTSYDAGVKSMITDCIDKAYRKEIIMFGDLLTNVRKTKPLIHNITNYVTVNDVANVLLAIGASPIMADDSEEVKEITSICNALNINIGTLNRSTIHSMISSGQKSNQLHHPVVLDPVGVGASSLRMETVMGLIRGININAIKGNMSEMKALARSYKNSQSFGKAEKGPASRGVDVNTDDLINEDNLSESIEFAKWFSSESHAISIITGPIDLVSDGTACYVIRNGRPEMEAVTGCGCQLSGLVAAYYAANPDRAFAACAAAVCTMGLAGEIAWNNMLPGDGNATYRNRIIDAICNMDSDTLHKGAKFEIR